MTFSRILGFLRTDVIWVLCGQLLALLVGLGSLKIFTNLFTASEYAYIALMMAISGWIWTGLYQPVNQTVFRFFLQAKEQGWQGSMFRYLVHYQVCLLLLIIVTALLIVAFLAFGEQPRSTILLVVLSSIMGVTYGVMHGVVSMFMAQRKRKPIALIQSFDGLFRLAGGLAAFIYISHNEYVVASGMVSAGVFFLIIILWLSYEKVKPFSFFQDIDDEKYRVEFFRYLKKMFLVMTLNASVLHLDKWLLFLLLGADGVGVYAVLYLLALTFTSVLYVFFEMLGFPLIIANKSKRVRKIFLLLLVFGYAICLVVVTVFIHNFGKEILLLLTTDYIAKENKIFTYLVIGLGIFNLARIAMVQGQLENQPAKYWPAYGVLLTFFIGWCLSYVEHNDGVIAAEGLIYGSIMFALSIFMLNFRRSDS